MKIKIHCMMEVIKQGECCHAIAFQRFIPLHWIIEVKMQFNRLTTFGTL
jgi:hypothetical protein